jgi:L-amino acid N-acyltransferase YncA
VGLGADLPGAQGLRRVREFSVYVARGRREVGVYRRHAQLDGEWRDTVIVELLLGE